MSRAGGKFFKPDPANPIAPAQCDRCERVVAHPSLIKQMEYMGRTLRWTGSFVCPRCVDRPQPQSVPKIVGPDPLPVKNPRREH